VTAVIAQVPCTSNAANVAQVGLDAGTSAGVGPGDGEGDDWFHAVNPTDVAAGVSTLGPWRTLQVGSISSTSRLVMGTGGFRSMDVLDASLACRGRPSPRWRFDGWTRAVEGSIYDLLERRNVSLLPNTAGWFSAAGEAVKVAELAREAFSTNVVKLEVIGDDVTLLPTRPRRWSPRAAGALGFEVWAYTSDDLIAALRLEQLGLRRGDAARLADRIGSGHPQPHAISLIAERVSVRSCSTRASARPRTPRWRWSWDATGCWSPRPSTAPWTR